MKDRFLILIILLTQLILAGCASQSVAPSAGATIVIDTKAQIKDLRRDLAQNAKIEIFLLKNQAIRMEVTALFGYQIASVVMTPKKIQFALHANKKYGEGPFTAKTLFPVFRQSVDPRLLWNVIHGKSPEGTELKCEHDSDNRPVSCVSSNGGVQVQYTYQEEPKKRIDIKSPQFEMNWIFREQALLKSAQNETFVLKKSAEYEEIAVK